MRITIVSPTPNLSGGMRVKAKYADILQERGHEVLVVSSPFKTVGFKSRAKALMKGRWLQTPSRESHFDRMKADLLLLDHDGPVTDADIPDADVVIATWWETAFAVAALSPNKGEKFYFVQGHEVHSHLPNHISAGSYYLPLHKIVVSGWLGEIMADRYGDTDVHLVPNSVDTSTFHALPRDRQSVPTIGLMYSTLPLKGVNTALEAIERVRQARPSTRLVAFGAKRPSSKLQLPSDTKFFLRPAQEELRKIYAMCDVFISASTSEGFGLPILEAMACRCPVVATRTGCAGDVIEQGVNGFLADVGDVNALAEGLLRVIDSSEKEWQSMSNAALAVASSYTWEDAADLFEAALTRSQRPPLDVAESE